VVAATALFGYLAQRLGLVAIVGYLVAGVAIGPEALGLIGDVELVEQMAEIGVIFLMFFIGLELSGESLRKMGSLMFWGWSASGWFDNRAGHGSIGVFLELTSIPASTPVASSLSVPPLWCSSCLPSETKPIAPPARLQLRF
jgi:Kef-type K+ transport system membrane component KefB